MKCRARRGRVQFEALEARRLFSTTPTSTTPAQMVAQADNVFAFDLFHELNKTNTGNIFFSPYSIASALQMTLQGMRGTTAAEVIQALHLPQEDLAQAGMAAMHQLFNVDPATAGYELSTANRLWVNQNFNLLQSFLDSEQAIFGAGPQTVDYSDPAAAAGIINAWVSAQTNGKITDLIPPGAIDQFTQLILTNAIYFKGDWATAFNPYGTQDAAFQNGDDTSTVNMMHQTNYFDYYAQSGPNGFQAIDLPYKGGGVDMTVILPTDPSLGDFESSFTPELYSQIVSGMHTADVSVSLPKFSLDEKYKLNQPLEDLGIHAAFQGGDFSGMMNQGPDDLVYISQVLHRSYIKVDETGTEAAGATAVIIGVQMTAIVVPPRPVAFDADHPFLLAIRDHATGTILFMGQVTDPGYDPAGNSPPAPPGTGGLILGGGGTLFPIQITLPEDPAQPPATGSTLPVKQIVVPTPIRAAGLGVGVQPTLGRLVLRPTSLKGAAKPERVVHLSYSLGKSSAPAKGKGNSLVNDWLSL